MAHQFTNAFYGKVAGASFVVGGCMEFFMIRTGFYDKVTSIEAQRLEESREEREEFLRKLRADLQEQSRKRGVDIKLPPAPGGGGAVGDDSGSG